MEGEGILRLCATLLVVALAACDGPKGAVVLAIPKADAPEVGYVMPPKVTSVARTGGLVLLKGTAPPAGTVRLATPGGPVGEVEAGEDGRWQLDIPASPEAQLYGLSVRLGERTIQSGGYLLITTQSRGYVLRAGGGSQAIGTSSKTAITVIDYDRQGGGMVSGYAPAGEVLLIKVDGGSPIEARSDVGGGFSVALTQPLSPGAHQVKLLAKTMTQTVATTISPATPLSDGPFRATETPVGLRLDWMTPGGGVQTTLILKPPS